MSRLTWTLTCVAAAVVILEVVILEVVIVAATGQNTCAPCQMTPTGCGFP